MNKLKFYILNHFQNLKNYKMNYKNFIINLNVELLVY